MRDLHTVFDCENTARGSFFCKFNFDKVVTFLTQFRGLDRVQ